MRTSISLVGSLGVLLSVTSASYGYLGSFGPNDGYQPQYGTVLGDVSYNNAGQNGANAGGGAWQNVAADSGLWSLQTPVGGVFANAAARAAFAATYPAYNPTPAGTAAIYLLGGHFPGRNNDGYNLAFRNDTPIGTGAARYRYSLDTYDTGGPVPSMVSSGTVSSSFYFRPNPADGAPSSGGRSDVKFTLGILDSSFNIGFQWGYARDNTVMWRTSPSNPWNYTAFVADQLDWDGVKFDIDLTADTFGIDYYDASAVTWNNIVPAGTPLGIAMANFTNLDWQLEDGVNLTASPNVGGKNYFDDFSFVVPEPASAALFLGVVPMLMGRRRRQ